MVTIVDIYVFYGNHKTSIMLLRKMTGKSLLGFGKHRDLTVQQLLDLHKNTYLVWMYYCLQHIDFFPEILDAIFIKEEHRITKPGKVSDEEFDKIMRKRVGAFISRSTNRVATAANLKVYKKRRNKSKAFVKSIKDNSDFSKGKMAWRNQGH